MEKTYKFYIDSPKTDFYIVEAAGETKEMALKTAVDNKLFRDAKDINYIAEVHEYQPKEEKGTIYLSDAVRVSDPCYHMDTWCAGTVENVLPGEFICLSQKVDAGDWGIRIANIEVRHKDYSDVAPTEWVSELDVGVDSGQCGLFDNEYFANVCGMDEFYDRVCNITYQKKEKENPEYVLFQDSPYYRPEYNDLIKYPEDTIMDNLSKMQNLRKMLDKTVDEDERQYIEKHTEDLPLYFAYARDWLRYKSNDYSSKKIITESDFEAGTIDEKGFVSSSGDGDGSYACFIGKNEDGKVVSIKIDYYPDYEKLEELENIQVDKER